MTKVSRATIVFWMSVNKRLCIATICLILCFFTLWTSQFVTDISIYNFSRAALVFLTGSTALLIVGHGFFQDFFKSGFFMKLSILVSSPFFLLAFLILTLSSTCSFTGRSPDAKNSANAETQKVRNTVVYLSYIGDKGALGYKGVGVFQEAPRKNMPGFFVVKKLCETNSKYDSISFKVLNKNQIECYINKNKKLITLPF